MAYDFYVTRSGFVTLIYKVGSEAGICSGVDSGSGSGAGSGSGVGSAAGSSGVSSGSAAGEAGSSDGETGSLVEVSFCTGSASVSSVVGKGEGAAGSC